jgi:hypothetical protein
MCEVMAEEQTEGGKSVTFDKERWMKAFESLPKERQEELSQWFATQILIMENLGIQEPEWFALIGWALDNPLDFSFMDEFLGQSTAEAAGDRREGAETAKAAALKTVGGQPEKNVATGAGLKEKAVSPGLDRELYQRFMADRLNERPGRPRPKKPPPKVR